MKFKLFALLVLALCIGCSENVSLRGTVLDENGNPITIGVVNFVSEQGLSRAQIQSDGSYVVGTLKERDGLPRGTYRVYVTNAEIYVPSQAPPRVDAMGHVSPAMPDTRPLIASRYTTEATTPIIVEVPAPGNRFDIVVTSFGN